ncbi:MAG: hypothetical protein QOI80_3178 [Solirubrobacteraceae bacterium]|jgi:hypothetical protein|nr:hypothetical protein [Solirubrobacteraceae bacterium]
MAPTDDVLLATVRDFAERSGATRVAVLLDRGPDRLAPLIEAEPGEPVTISQGEENLIVLPADLAEVVPLPLDVPKALPATALDVDPVKGEVEAPIGALRAIADGVVALALQLGGRSVVHAEFATRSGIPLSLAGRPGEPVVVTAGDQQFELPE